jgi:predicted transcriptional regulator
MQEPAAKCEVIIAQPLKSPKDAMAGFSQAWKSGRQQKAARITFASPELLWKVLTAKRWELLKALCGAGPVSIRETSRRIGRDVKGVHGDVIALIEAGLLNRTKNGGIEFPYEAIKVEFLLQAA